MKKKDIEILTLRMTTQNQAVEKEAQEKAEMESAIAAISAQHETRASHRDQLRQQIADTQKLINQRLEAQRQHAKQLDAQAQFNGPELDFWQDYLCLRIEGAGMEDRLKFVYTHVDERDWEKEAWFELGMGKREYEVLHSRPKLEAEILQQVLDRLNESRDLGAFLKRIRELFVDALKAR